MFAAEKATPAMVNSRSGTAAASVCAGLARHRGQARLLLRLITRRASARRPRSPWTCCAARRPAFRRQTARARTARARPDAKASDFARPGHCSAAAPRRVACSAAGAQRSRPGSVSHRRPPAGRGSAAVAGRRRQHDAHAGAAPLRAQARCSASRTIRDLIEWRRHRERLVRRVITVPLPTEDGSFQMLPADVLEGEPRRASCEGQDHARQEHARPRALAVPSPRRRVRLVPLRLRTTAAMRRAIEKRGSGILLYLRQEGRGIGLCEQRCARTRCRDLRPIPHCRGEHQAQLPADLRDYGIGAQVLADLGVRKIDLLHEQPAQGRRSRGVPVSRSRRAFPCR